MSDARLQDLYRHALDARQAGDRSECAAPERLLALARREGSEEERLRTLDHVMSCADCLRELELLRAIEQTGARTGANVSTVRRAGGWWRRGAPLALAASLILAVSLVVRQRGDVAGDATRGATEQIVVHSSRDIELAPSDSVVLAWRPEPGATRYVVEVLGDDGRPALTATTPDTVLVLRDLGRLVPERSYRWWIRAFGAAGGQRTSALGTLRVAKK